MVLLAVVYDKQTECEGGEVRGEEAIHPHATEVPETQNEQKTQSENKTRDL